MQQSSTTITLPMKICSIIVIAILLAMPVGAKEPSRMRIKKISIIESNNILLNGKSESIPFTAEMGDPYLTSLKEYVSKRITLTNRDELSTIFSLLEWVSNQWQHDGVNSPPARANALDILTLAAQGERFSCNSYATVVTDVLLSYGYIARIISLNSKDIAYGTFGMGHVAAEVWSNTLQKWIFIDPQYSMYAMYNGEYLNYYDIYRLRAESKYKEIEFHVAESHLKINHQTKDEAITQYRAFLSEYFGYVTTAYEHTNTISMLVLPLDAKDQYLTNQGRTSHPLVFTEDPSDFYFPINNTLVVFMQNTCAQSSSPPANATPTNFTLTFQNNMPWFDHYEYRNSQNAWVATKTDSLPWHVVEGISTVTVRAVNMAGVAGVATSIKLRYE